MDGSLIFVMWPNENNVVVSSRYASFFLNCLPQLRSSGQFKPVVYRGPSVSVLSSTITSTEFSAILQLKNATKWQDNGKLNIDSSDTGVIWAFGTDPPDDRSNPSSDFQKHKIMGTFSVDLKSAQVNYDMLSRMKLDDRALTPMVRRSVYDGTGTGLSHRDKVYLSERLFSL